MSEPTLVTLLAILEVLYVVALGGWIVLEKRSPVATLAWLLALVALPGVGFVVYFFLGPRRVHRRRLRRVRASQAVLRPHDDFADASTEQRLVRIGGRYGARLSRARTVTVYASGAETMSAIVSAITAARDHVHVLYYIFEPDETGRQVRDALVERARAGVRVRLLVDGVGSAHALFGGAVGRDFFAPLRAAGGKVVVFNPPRITRLFGRLLNFRNHRKIVVCDGLVGFTGGINVTDEENGAVNPAAWRDTHLRLTGPAVAWLQVVFLEDWCYATGASPGADARTAFFPAAAPGDEGPLVQILESGPDRSHEAIRDAYFAAVSSAHARVLVTSAYFVPDEPMLLALKSAAMRGVDVRVLVPAQSDSRVAAAAARSYYDELLGAGVKILEYGPPMIHAKTMVVDEAVSFVGTANLDHRSFRLNFEVTALVFDEETAATLANAFERDAAGARAVTHATRTRLPFASRFAEGSARLLSPLL